MNAASDSLVRAGGGSRPLTVIKPSGGWAALRIHEIWSFRELMYFLVWRDLKVRYRQTALGVLWVLLQPLVMMIVIAVFFGLVIDVPSDGVPYPIFVLTALLPWTFFSQSVMAGSQSLVMNATLIAKIYFPRLLLPLAGAGSYLLDFAVAMVLLVVMMFIYSAEPTWAIVLLPLLATLALVTALGVGTLLAAVNVRYRDVASGVPPLLQVWLFASPIAYSFTLIPENLQTLYGLNPMASVVTGFRWALLGTPAPPAGMVALSVVVAVGLFVLGVAYFRRTERSFADVI
jgi:lipopolysaccharide transport system permease protein